MKRSGKPVKSSLSSRMVLCGLLVSLTTLFSTEAQDFPKGPFSLEETPWVSSDFTPSTPKEVLTAYRIAQNQGKSEQALQILLRGKRLFPQATEIHIALGDLFAGKELYPLALEAYREAEALAPEEVTLWSRIAVTYGKLEQADQAARYYERIHAKRPDSLDAVADLGWIYFKTHQLKKGKALLEEGVRKFGPERRLAMTLGTTCAGLYLYEEAKRYYQLAIQDALAKKDNRFASVAYYNLAILEKSFQRYEEALRATERSLALEPRAPGYLSLGDLHEGSMNFPIAESAYLKAQQLDQTPLSRLSLANLYRKFGHLEKALSLGKELLEQSDYAWMYYFGTSKDRHLMDVHELLRDTYRGLENQLALEKSGSLKEWAGRTFRRLYYGLLASYHGHAFRAHAARVAESYQKEDNPLHTYITCKRAMESYPSRALFYLEKAGELELAINPEATRFYLLERGKLTKDLSLLTLASDLFASPWERENRENALVHRALLLTKRAQSGDTETRRLAREDLERTLRWIHEINPGALAQQGIRYPITE